MEQILKTDVANEEIQDPHYERHKYQLEINEKPFSQVDVKKLQQNPINDMVDCFHQLSKIAGKPEGNNENLDLIRTPQIKLGLNNYKKKKRKELINKYRHDPLYEKEIESWIAHHKECVSSESESSDDSTEHNFLSPKLKKDGGEKGENQQVFEY